MSEPLDIRELGRELVREVDHKHSLGRGGQCIEDTFLLVGLVVWDLVENDKEIARIKKYKADRKNLNIKLATGD